MDWLIQEGIDLFDVLTVVCTALLTKLVHAERRRRKQEKKHRHHG